MEEIPPRQAAARERGTGARLVLVVLISSLLAGAAGGAVAVGLDRLLYPRTDSPATAGGLSDVAGAAAAVLPAVVTVISSGGGQTVSGSGFVIDRAKGHVVTSSHVIELPRTTTPSGEVTVLLASGRTLAARVLGNDPEHDIAVLKVDGALDGEVVLSAAEAAVGAEVIAIGTPGVGSGIAPLTNTVTLGVVSATGRRIPREDLRNVILTDLIQTDASIGEGMSGGPLVLVATKQVVGINTLLIRGQTDLAFAVSSITLRRVVDEILARAAP